MSDASIEEEAKISVQEDKEVSEVEAKISVQKDKEVLEVKAKQVKCVTTLRYYNNNQFHLTK